MGTPGHMAHPFDVERVRTGQDLIDFINDAVLRLQNQEIAGSVKWDGINTSFKLITGEDGDKEFRMDRGTNHTDSVIGLDAEAALAKWGPEHGMANAVATLLKIFNAAIPQTRSELKELGMWDDPTKYFNTEYIEGKSNVQEYDENILAIHGINQFYEKKAQPHAIRKGTSMDRPGLERPIDPATQKPVKGGGIEIPYNKEALTSLIEKVQPIAEKYGFEVYGDVPVEFDPEGDLDIEKVLDTPVSIQVVPGGVETAPLREWLKGVVHPQDKKITRADGKSVGALSKDAYMAVLKSATDEGIPLSQYLESQEDVKDAINGGIFYHATRLLGQAVKNALTSKAGNVGKHEGVVLRGMEDFLVKLTGDFIVQGLASTHGDQSKQSLTEHPLRWTEGLTYSETLITEQDVERIAAVAGGFKPPHKGHFEMIKHYANMADKVKLFIGESEREIKGDPGNRSITAEQSAAIWDQYLSDAGLSDRVDIEVISGSPMKASYSVLEDALPGQTILMGCGQKDTYFTPDDLARYAPEGVTAEPAPCPTILDPNTNQPYSATAVRATIVNNDLESFRHFLPDVSQHRAEEIFGLLGGGIQEIATMAGGGVAGSMNRGRRKEDNQNEQLVNEVMNYLLGISAG